MHHAGRHVINAAWSKLHSVSLTCECGFTTDHCVGLVCRMPVLPHMKGFRRADQQLGGFGLWVYMRSRVFIAIAETCELTNGGLDMLGKYFASCFFTAAATCVLANSSL